MVRECRIGLAFHQGVHHLSQAGVLLELVLAGLELRGLPEDLQSRHEQIGVIDHPLALELVRDVGQCRPCTTTTRSDGSGPSA